MTVRHGDHHPPVTPEFDARRQSLMLYYQALSGRTCELVAYGDDADVWQHPDTATTVRLPFRPPLPADGTVGSELWYRVATTHRAMHQLFATFDLDLDRAEPLFVRRRPAPRTGVPPLEGFLRHFGRTALAVEVFAALEDLRIDAAAMRRLPGLAPAYEAVMAAALDGRPEPAQLPPRAAIAEALVRFTLGAGSTAIAPSLDVPLSSVVAAARLLKDPRATVESTAEATIRVYSVLARLPNVGALPGGAPVRFADLDAAVEAPGHVAIGDEIRLEGDDLLDVRFVPVRFRDVPGPRYLGQATSGMPLHEAILRVTPIDDAPAESPGAGDHGFTAKSLQAERGDVDVTAVERPPGPPAPLPHDHGPDLGDYHHAAEGSLRPSPGQFVYPEWDDVAGRYRPDWCLVRLCQPRPVRSGISHRRVLSEYGRLLPALVRRLEQVYPEGRDLALRQPFGDDLDLDACVEALVDLRTGAEPKEQVFAAFAEHSRDVAVTIALDLSSSTAERIEGTSRAGRPMRIIDLQRAAVTLLSEALERVGDSYGIYGFSGTGRADCRVTVVKEIDERRSPMVLHRLQGIRPDHTTRLAPAIRHLTRRLDRHAAASRLLLIVSDGRPFDLDYGQQYGEDAVLRYALADTARALDEARRRGVRPYLITVDPDGGDYLGDVCDAREYHVIGNARDLPTALAELYLVARNDLRRRLPNPASAS